MNDKAKARKASAGQVAAARLLVKRANEGKATVTVTDRVRRIAEQGRPAKVA